MELETLIPILIFLGVGLVIVVGVFALIFSFIKKVEQGKALVVNKFSKTEVSFTGMVVLPIIHKAEIMEISVKTIEVERRGKEGLICMDNIRADIKVTFFVRVNKTKEDVLKVAQSIGCARASNQDTLEELFAAKFSEALKTVGKRLEFEDLYKERDHFKDQIIEVIGHDLNGYVLEDAAIDFLEQTPIEVLDPQNILDSQGIRKITELTSGQRVRTNEFTRDAEKRIKKQDVEAREAILSLERQQADAEAKQMREIETVKARETAEISKVRSEEKQRAESARIKAEEEIEVQEQNKQRQVEVAGKNRERVIGIETERVEKDRMLEAITRERETEVKRIEKEKVLEKERKEIQDIIRERIAVEKTVAEEEERIKDLRVVAEAKRNKEKMVIHAEAEAQEMFVKDLKAAEVQEQSAKHEARRRLTLADAALDAAEKEAKAKIRMAEGTRAEHAAQGLADAEVKEADAVALERQGLARVKVKEADANANRMQGEAEADILRGRMAAEAEGAESQGLARARVRHAEADATEHAGRADAAAIREKLVAEAAGLTEKAEAMKALDGDSRAHEEFRIRLEATKAIELERIHIQKDIAMAQAEVLGAGLKNAKIDIVGGESIFVDRLMNAISAGKSLDGMVSRSETAQSLLGDYLSGEGNLVKDLRGVMAGLGTEDLENLTVSAFLGKLMGAAKDPQDKAALQRMITQAGEPSPKG